MTRDELEQRAAALVDRLSGGSRDDPARDALLRDILAFQAEHVPPYARLLAARGLDAQRVADPGALPALPTEVLRHVRVAVHPASEDVRVFRTSGTTSGRRGEHFFSDLALYDRAARAAARWALFPDVERIRIVCLTPSPDEMPDSSLSYMLGRFGAFFGDGPALFAWRGGVDAEALRGALRTAADARAPVALLGTSFAFAQADAVLAAERFSLPEGSRIMQTGGFKGRTRELSPEEMRAMLRARYGVSEDRIVAEYGMTELSSQMYETTLRAPTEPRRLWVPGWMRATPVHPETLAAVPEGEVGILRVDDVANVGSLAAIQTSDLARTVGGGIELLGRAPGAIPRGCSLTAEEALGGSL